MRNRKTTAGADARPAAAPRDLVKRPTALAEAMLAACDKAGIDVSSARVPVKREPAWRVSRREAR